MDHHLSPQSYVELDDLKITQLVGYKWSYGDYDGPIKSMDETMRRNHGIIKVVMEGGKAVLYLTILFGIALVHFPVMVSPGPNFLLVTQTAVSQSRRASVLTALGIATGAAVWAATASMGIGIMLVKLHWLFRFMRILGGAYIVYIGVRMWLRKNPKTKVSTMTTPQRYSPFRMFRVGLLTNLTNPKSAVFFGSIFAALLGPNLPIWVRLAAVFMIAFNALWWHVTLAFVFSGKRVQRIYASVQRWVDLLAGSFLTFMGLRLIWESRT